MRIDMDKQMVKSRMISGQNFIASAQQKAKEKQEEEQIASKVQKALDGAATFEISEEGKAKLKDQQRLMEASTAQQEEKEQLQDSFDPVAVSAKAAKSYQEKVRQEQAIIDVKNEVREAGEKTLEGYEAQAELYGEDDQAVIEQAKADLAAATDTSIEEGLINDAINGVEGVVVNGAHSAVVLQKEALKGESILEPDVAQPGAEAKLTQAANDALLETYVNKRHEGEAMEEQIAPPQEGEEKADDAAEKQAEEATKPQDSDVIGSLRQDAANEIASAGMTLQEQEEAAKRGL